MILSNPDRLLWPQAGISKQGLLDHYKAVWPRMERFIVNRPLSLVRAPDGVEGQRFFQKHASKGMPELIVTMNDPQDGEELLFNPRLRRAGGTCPVQRRRGPYLGRDH